MYSQIAANKRKTIFLMAGFIALISGLGWIFSEAWQSPGLLWGALIFAVVYTLISYFASAKIALALTGAKLIQKKDAPQLYRIVENLAITAGLPTPKVYIINDPAPNAFATGRDPNHGVVAVTTGLLEMLDDTELEGVIAHELGHIGNYDIRLTAIVVTLVSVIAIISDFFLRVTWHDEDDDSGGNTVFVVIGIVAAILAPIAATIIQLAVSRKREYLADASGALLTRHPEGLASALAKIAADKRLLKKADGATAHLFIASPLRGRGIGAGISKLFSTHPPMEDRIAKLKSMGSEV